NSGRRKPRLMRSSRTARQASVLSPPMLLIASTTFWPSGKHGVELAADHLFDELADPSAHLGLDRIKPVVEKINSHLGCRLRRIRLRGSARHGVVSSPALQRRMIRG